MTFKIGDKIKVIGKSLTSQGFSIYGKKAVIVGETSIGEFIYHLLDVPERENVNHYMAVHSDYEILKEKDDRLANWLKCNDHGKIKMSYKRKYNHNFVNDQALEALYHAGGAEAVRKFIDEAIRKSIEDLDEINLKEDND